MVCGPTAKFATGLEDYELRESITRKILGIRMTYSRVDSRLSARWDRDAKDISPSLLASSVSRLRASGVAMCSNTRIA